MNKSLITLDSPEKKSSNWKDFLSEPQLQLLRLRAEKARRSLKEFVQSAWMVVEPSTPFVPGWHVDAIIEHLEAVTNGLIRNLVINVPPRHMKSLLVSVFWPAWEWIRRPERRWLFSSYGAQLSIRDSLKCRRLIESPWYRRNWGDRFALTSDCQMSAKTTIAASHLLKRHMTRLMTRGTD